MKIAMYSLLTLAFSALVFTPVSSKQYFDKDKLESRIIIYKENRLKRSFENIEYQIKKDSLEIEFLKRNTN